jgi:protein-tyrosine-phosphatase
VSPPLRTILFVCQANTSRSVMAQALLERLLDERGLGARYRVTAGGIAPYARDGALVSLDARLALREVGIALPPERTSVDLKQHRYLIAQADLILAMTEAQVSMLRAGFPEAEGKAIHTVRSLAGEGGDIDDPVGRGDAFYAECRDQIERCLRRSLARLP